MKNKLLGILLTVSLLPAFATASAPQQPTPKEAIISAPNNVTSLAVPATPLTPDQYAQYAQQDPGFLSLKSALTGNEDAYRAALRGGINSGVISLGAAPTDASVAPYLDPGTADAAAANPLSTSAQLTTQHQQNTRSIQNNLAARGAYDSGELTYGLGNENTRDTQARSDAMASFLKYANGLFSGLGSMQASDAAQLGTELGNAAMRQLALHPGSTVSAAWDDTRGAYFDAQGNAYDQWGNHITSAGDGSPPPTNFGPSNPNGVGYAPNGVPADWQPAAPNGATDNAFFVTPSTDNQPIITRGGGGINSRPY